MGRNGEFFNEKEKETLRQVRVGLGQTLARGATTNRPIHDFSEIQTRMASLGRREFESHKDGLRLQLALEIHLQPDESITAVSDIILSVKRQHTGLDISRLLGSFIPDFLRKRKKTTPDNANGDTYLKLTPNGYQIADMETSLSRRGRLMQYTPEAAEPIGKITAEFLTHLRRTLDAER